MKRENMRWIINPGMGLLLSFFLSPFLFAEDIVIDLSRQPHIGHVKIKPGPVRKGFIAHEWGSMEYLYGDSGLIIDGVSTNHKEIPPFVHLWKKQKFAPRAIRKPILYFYTKREMTVNVLVENRLGVWTEWWPQVNSFYPESKAGRVAKGGSLMWKVHLVPQSGKAFREVEGKSWWPLLRETDAVPLTSNQVTEKFLFYRGLAHGQPHIGLKLEGEKVSIINKREREIQGLYLVHISKGKALHKRIPAVPGQGTVEAHISLQHGGKNYQPILPQAEKAQRALKAALEKRGLYAKEAEGMATIWQREFFQEEGLRLIYFLPREDIDTFFPITMNPSPEEFVRVMTVKVEYLLPEEKKKIETLITQLGNEHFEVREEAEATLLQMPKAVGVLREAFQEVSDPEIKMRINRILHTKT